MCLTAWSGSGLKRWMIYNHCPWAAVQQASHVATPWAMTLMQVFDSRLETPVSALGCLLCFVSVLHHKHWAWTGRDATLSGDIAGIKTEWMDDDFLFLFCICCITASLCMSAIYLPKSIKRNKKSSFYNTAHIIWIWKKSTRQKHNMS